MRQKNIFKASVYFACILTVLAFICVQGAKADEVDNWFEHQIPAAEPQVTYDGKAFNLKFSHPSPPASLVPPVWRAGLSWHEKATNGKLIFK